MKKLCAVILLAVSSSALAQQGPRPTDAELAGRLNALIQQRDAAANDAVVARGAIAELQSQLEQVKARADAAEAKLKAAAPEPEKK